MPRYGTATLQALYPPRLDNRLMRKNLLTKHTTKPERKVYEVLKKLRIPFRHRWLIHGREIDFVIGPLCLEIDGHEQDVAKNNMLAELGFIPLHVHNSEVSEEYITQLLIKYNAYTPST